MFNSRMACEMTQCCYRKTFWPTTKGLVFSIEQREMPFEIQVCFRTRSLREQCAGDFEGVHGNTLP